MKKRDSVNKKLLCVGAICSLVSLFTACEVLGPEPEPEPVTGSYEKAVAHIQIESGIPGRTVRPNATLEDVSVWKLLGGKLGEDADTLLEFDVVADATIALEPGEWSFTIKGYKGGASILSGSIAEQTISLEGTQILAFEVEPVEIGEGTVSITINLPEGSGITEARVFKDGNPHGSPIPPVGDTIAFTEISDAGAYYYSFKLYNEEDDKPLGVVSEMVHVGANLTSAKTYTLARKDLNLVYTIKYHVWDEVALDWDDTTVEDGHYQIAAAKPLAERPTSGVYSIKGWYEQPDFSGGVVTQIPVGSTGDRDFYAKWIRTFSGPSLADALASINAGQEADDEYLIILEGDETWTTTQDLTATGGKEIAITIDGSGKTISLDPNGDNGSLFTLGAESGSSLTLVLEDITLQGKDDNNASVVQVNSGATLDLQDDSFITGNTSYPSFGGGVSVGGGGALTMSGGKISGNTASGNVSTISGNNGGGVAVASGGTFTMTGGEISGNKATGNYSSGGGVYIEGGTFTMTGGVISGNSTPSSVSVSGRGGGGVLVTAGGKFTMTGGEVSGNSSNNDGGGVFIYRGTFEMSGGAVSGNTAILGGGVAVASGGTFTMTGGVVYGSEAEDSKRNTAPSGGAMMYLFGGSAKLDGVTSGTRDTTIDLRQVTP